MKKSIADLAKLEDLTNQEAEVLRWIARGASDQDIAESLFLSVNTIKWHNRNIYAKLGVQNRTQAVYEAGRRGLLDQDYLIPAFSNHDQKYRLPAEVSSFVGRDKEVPRIQESLKSTRLLTLTGPGGVGKTRLALTVSNACRTGENFLHGVYWVDLAPHNRSDWVADVIAENLGLAAGVGCSSPELLIESLQDKQLLLVIDNFEHLLPAAPLIHDLLTHSPRLNILVTSREALKLSGETIYPVPPLELPDLDNADLSIWSETEAIRLFVERAQAVKNSYTPGEEDLSFIAEICARLDGLPLAIELAAAQVKYLTPGEILNQINDRFGLLADAPRDAPSRHQSMERAIDWSYEGLTPDLKTLFNRLSVFQGGRTIPAAQAVCCEDLDLDVRDGFRSLLDKHLVQSEISPDGEPRFTFLETLHEYARLRLEESGEAEDIKLRHAVYFSDLADAGKYPLRGGPEQVHWLQKIRGEHKNLRKAFFWSMENEQYGLGLKIVGGLGFFWMREFHFRECIEWTDLALTFVDEVPLEIQAGVYCSAGIAAYNSSDFALMAKHAQKAKEINYLLEDNRELGWLHTFSMNLYLGNLAEEQTLNMEYSKAIEYLEDTGEKSGLTIAHYLMAIYKANLNEMDQAKSFLKMSWDIAEEIGDSARQVMILAELGSSLINEGKYKLAQDILLSSLEMEVHLGTKAEWAAGTFLDLARSAIHLDNPLRGIKLLAAAYAIFDAWDGLEQPGYSEADFLKIKDTALLKVNQHEVEKAWNKGLKLDPNEAIKYAFQEFDPEVDISMAWF